MSAAIMIAKNNNCTISKNIIKAIEKKGYLKGFKKKKNQVEVLLDCSGSMEGEKISQAKNGIFSLFQESAKAGYSAELISFANSAELICSKNSQKQIKEITNTIKTNGYTNMVDALLLAENRLTGINGQKAIVLATDGYPNNPKETIEIAKKLKKQNIEIITIGTDDADEEFLKKLASHESLGIKVKRKEFQSAIAGSAKKMLTLNI